MSRTPVLEMRNIAKTFGNFHALKGVDLTVFPGEIHALMGGKRRRKKHADEDPRRCLYRQQRRHPHRR